MLKYVFNVEDINRCRDFATKVVSTNVDEYARRRQGDPEKIKHQIIVGKIAEIAAAKLLETENGPDFAIYDSKGKSFDSDLRDWEGRHYHVKAQTVEQGKRYGVSWVFQKTDPLIKLPSEQDYIVLCQVDMGKKEVTICKVLRAMYALEDELYAPMKLPHLSSKCALYLEDLT